MAHTCVFGLYHCVFSTEATVVYIHRQAERHKKVDFQQEFLAFLKKHNIAYDPQYIWG